MARSSSQFFNMHLLSLIKKLYATFYAKIKQKTSLKIKGLKFKNKIFKLRNIIFELFTKKVTRFLLNFFLSE